MTRAGAGDTMPPMSDTLGEPPANEPWLDEDEHEPDPPEFDRAKMPDGPGAELLLDGRTGRGLTNAEYDELVRRYHEAGETLPWEVSPDVG